MFEDFFNHTCNIYHLEDESTDIGYGIRATDVKKPQKKADEKEVRCHFYIRSNGVKIVQKEPYSSADGEMKLSLPVGTNIKMNDTVEDCRDGLMYRAGKPMEVHGGHHIIVMLSRMEGVKGAI